MCSQKSRLARSSLPCEGEFFGVSNTIRQFSQRNAISLMTSSQSKPTMNIQRSFTELHSIVRMKKMRGTLCTKNFNKSMSHDSLSFVAKYSATHKFRTIILIDEHGFVASKPHRLIIHQIHLAAENIWFYSILVYGLQVVSSSPSSFFCNTDRGPYTAEWPGTA